MKKPIEKFIKKYRVRGFDNIRSDLGFLVRSHVTAKYVSDKKGYGVQLRLEGQEGDFGIRYSAEWAIRRRGY